MKRRLAQLPLHSGKAPPWLFKRMTKMAGAVTMAIVEEFGADEMLRRLADPWWFQAFGCVLGFDWHSSGVTTVTCGALKEAAKQCGDDLGILVAGGKGAVSRKTPQEIAEAADRKVRSLSLIAEIIFDAPPSHRDPAMKAPHPEASTSSESRRWADYSYAHGGKDGTPFPVDRDTYDQNIAVLADAVRRARLGQNDKFHALRRLTRR